MLRSFSGCIVLSFKFMHDLDVMCTFVQFVAESSPHSGLRNTQLSTILSLMVDAEGLQVITSCTFCTVSGGTTGLSGCSSSSTLPVRWNLLTRFFIASLVGPGFLNLRVKSAHVCSYVIPRRRAETTAILSSLVSILLYYLQQKIIQSLYHQNV